MCFAINTIDKHDNKPYVIADRLENIPSLRLILNEYGEKKEKILSVKCKALQYFISHGKIERRHVFERENQVHHRTRFAGSMNEAGYYPSL